MKNILIIKTAAIGDVLRTTVILEGLVEKYANPKIYWLTSKIAKPLLDNNPFIEQLFYVDDPGQEVLKKEYDFVISLEENKEILEIVSKVKKKKLFGMYLEKNEIKYTQRSALWNDMGLSSRFGKKIADELKKTNLFSYPELLYKMLDLPWKKQRYRLFLTKKDLNYAKILKQAITEDKIVIGFVVGAGNRWPMKSLPVDKQIKLIKKLHSKFGKKVNILALAGNSELELGNTKEIKKKCPFVLTHDVKDIDEFIGIVNICDVVISPDTLSMHIAIALSKHVIVYVTVTSSAELEVYVGDKIQANHPDYCSYIKINKNRPNITDSIDLNEIVNKTAKIIKIKS